MDVLRPAIKRLTFLRSVHRTIVNARDPCLVTGNMIEHSLDDLGFCRFAAEPPS